MKKVILTISTVLLIFVAVGYVVLFTRSGFSVVIASAQKLSGGALKVESAAGVLARSFSLERLRYSSENTTVELESLTLAWEPAKLFQGRVHCRSLVVDGLYVKHESKQQDLSAPRDGVSLPEFDLPIGVDVESAEITDIVFDSGDSGRLQIDSIAIAVLAGRKTLELNALTVTSRQADLDVSGSVGLGGDWPVDLDGQWRYNVSGLPPLRGSYSISRSLADGLLEVDVLEPAAIGLVSDFSIKGGLRFQARLLADDFDPSVLVDTVHGSANLDARISGRVEEGELDIAFALDSLSGDIQSLPLRVSGEGGCTTDGCRLSDWKVVSRSAELRFTGEAGSRLDLAYELDVGSVGDFQEGAEGAAKVEGRIEGMISAPRITADIQVDAPGFAEYGAGGISGDLSVDLQNERQITADLVVEEIEALGRRFDAVQLHVAGSPSRHRLEAVLEDDEISLSIGAAGGLQASEWQGELEEFTISSSPYGEMALASGAGLRLGGGGFSLGRSCLEKEEATLCLEAELQGDRWQAGMEMHNFDPALFFEGWSGNVSAELEGTGKIVAGATTASLNLSRLTGSLMGEELDGSGRVYTDGRAWRLKGVELRYGEGRVTIEGTVDQQGYDLAFRSSLPDLSLLRSDLQGRLEAEGTLAGQRQKPRLQAFVEGDSLLAANLRLEEFSGTVDGGLHPAASVAVDLRARNLEIASHRIDEIGLEASGTMADHRFSAAVSRPDQQLRITGAGSYDGSWRGHLQEMSIAAADWADFRLSGRPSFTVDAGGGALENLCLVSPRADFCISGRMEGGGWQALASVTSFDTGLLGDAGLTTLPLAGDVSAQLSVEGQSQQLEELSGWVRAPQIILHGSTEYRFLQSRLEVSLQEGTLVCDLHSNFEEKGEVEGELRLQDFAGIVSGNTSLPLAGKVEANIDDLGFVTFLTDEILQPSGHLRISIDIGGSLDAPLVTGTAELDEGEIYLAEQGITLTNVTVGARYENGEFPYEISATSGPGQARGEGVLWFGPGGAWKLRSDIVGSNFEVLATEEYLIRTSPDVRLGFGEGEQFIEGRLDIPYARIVLEAEKSRISPSKDVVIVDEQGGEVERRGDLVIDLEVELGEDVKIDAYGLESSLHGGIELEDSPGSLLSATGELQVEEAEFSFYSVELRVTRGRLLFSGGPIDNPGVDFRAVRRVENRVVGVEVSGTAQDLEFQLFSDPAMSESDILAYMLVGRSMYASSGDDQSLIDAAASSLGIRGINKITSGLQKYVPIDEIYLDGSTGTEDISLVLGKYITDDLFVGYDHNFFDRAGQFKARYDLGNNFSVETRSSTNSTSGDILYTIEK